MLVLHGLIGHTVFRYVAFAWSARSASRSYHVRQLAAGLESERAWQVATDQPALKVYFRDSSRGFLEPHVLANDGGVILGRVFGNSGLDATALLGLVNPANRARALIDRCWGRYVALLRNPDTRTIEVVRDPSGAVRCFHALNGGVHIFCSHAEDLVAMGLPFSINWNYVVAELANQAEMGWEQTGLHELTALRGGECLEISEHASRKFPLWDIARFGRSDAGQPNVREVHDTIRHCVTSWVACHRHVALLLSGGLDSSVILSCLRNEGSTATVSCLNYFFGGGYRADERSYARLVAERANCDLVELERSADIRLDRLLALPKSARPSHNALDHLLSHERTVAWAKEKGATAIVTGDFGDQLFCQQLVAHAPIDCLWTRGFGGELLRVASEVARIEGGSIWRHLLTAAVYGYASRFRRLRRRAMRAERRFDSNPYLHAKIAEAYDHRLQQKWADNIDDVPLGKLLHIAAVAAGQAYLTPIGGSTDPEWIAPLSSQPIIEMCLRIPVWEFVRGGQDRSVLRRAFAQEVPAEIIRRRSKGTTSTQRVAVYSRNADFVRETLLDGVLAGKGLLDVDRLARDLRVRDYSHNIWLERCLRTEAWLRVWNFGDTGSSARDAHLSLSARYA